MAHTNFETPIPTKMRGSIGARVFEGGGVDPTRLIRTDTPWRVELNWKLEGDPDVIAMICGRWHVHVRLESMGPGGELSMFDPDCDIPLKPADPNYTCSFDVPAGRVQAAHDGTPYRLVVTLTYRNSVGRAGPMAAYYDAGIYTFYNVD